MRHDARGFVAIEWVAAVAMLLLPVVVLVAMMPTWVERRHGATVAAREAANILVRTWPNDDVDRATEVAREVARDHGIDAVDVHVRSLGAGRGDDVRVEVEIEMPAIAVAGMSVGRWHYTALAVRRVDDYRSR